MAQPGLTRRPLPVALIDEAACIGCTICIQKCPVDAIVGANRRMHTVITAQCIGCRLCIAPCPVDCITMVDPPPDAGRVDPSEVRDRYRFRRLRLERDQRERVIRFADTARLKLMQMEGLPSDAETARKRAVIERALARAKARQQG